MEKHILDLLVTKVEAPASAFVLLRMRPVEGRMPTCLPGQFAQLRIDAPGVFLRRPISIHDIHDDEISFLVQVVGQGTRWLASLKPGDRVNAVLPLGNGFTIPQPGTNVLLVGGGVGVAPLYFLGRSLKAEGLRPTFLLGARTRDALLCLDAFQALGEVLVTTEDGSLGERGFVTQHSVLVERRFDLVQTCGPTPMMKAVARYAGEQGIPCEVSLENRMACGVGACLCCVQETQEGHKCVCTDGPVFNVDELKW